MRTDTLLQALYGDSSTPLPIVQPSVVVSYYLAKHTYWLVSTSMARSFTLDHF